MAAALQRERRYNAISRFVFLFQLFNKASADFSLHRVSVLFSLVEQAGQVFTESSRIFLITKNVNGVSKVSLLVTS